MNYTKEQIASIEKVHTVFADYIQSKNDTDFLYSQKAGYLLLYGIKPEEGYMTMAPMFIKDGSMLCDFFLYEIACDVMRTLKSTRDVHEANYEERRLIEQAFEPYITQLSEYRHLILKQFQNPWERELQ